MAQTVQRSILPSTRAFDKTRIFQKRSECLMYILADSAITQTKHGQIYTIIQQLLKLHVLDVVTASVNAFEIIYGATSADDVTPVSFT